MNLFPDMDRALHFEKDMPLTRFSDVPDVEVSPDMVKTVARQGVWLPIICGKVGRRFIVEDGLRRISAARKAGLETVPVVWHEHATPAATITINSCRSRNWRAEFQAFLKLTDSGLSVDEIAEEMGLSKGRLAPFVRLAKKLNPVAQQAFIDGHISFATAKKMMRLPDSAQAQVLREAEEAEDKAKAIAEGIEQINAARAAVAELPPSLFDDRITVINLLEQAARILTGDGQDVPDEHAKLHKAICDALVIAKGGEA